MIAVAGGILIVLLILAALYVGVVMVADGNTGTGAFTLLAALGLIVWMIF